MKRRILFFLFMMLFGAGKAFAYDFSAVSPSGHTLYYNIISSSAHTVGLVNPKANGNDVSGNVIVPETVVRNGVNYTVTSLRRYNGWGTFEKTSITSVTLPATITNVNGEAFYMCSSLRCITIYATTPPVIDGDYVERTFDDIASDCVLRVPEGTENLYASAWGSRFHGQIRSFTFSFTAQTDNVTVSMEAVGAAPSVSLEYRTNDNQTWQDFVVGTTQVTINQGDVLYVKAKNANNKTASGENDYNRFVVTNSASVGGNIMYLLDPTGGMTEMTSANSWAFGYLFGNCSHITDASQLELPAVKLASRCYWRMFSGCSSLATAPELPATTLAIYCYGYMFRACSSLTTAPALPATTLANYCYNSMFYGCSSLTAAPTLPATTLASNCYASMFQYCSGLTTVPALPATTLTEKCYYAMFYGCSGLTVAPALPATTLASSCYQSMFYGCTNLTAAPALQATTLASNCCFQMFRGCSNLTVAPTLPATTLASNCYQSMFYGCTSLTAAPALPATTLASNCYSQMFKGCSSLTAAPTLPATTLASDCYGSMFQNCSSIKSVTTYAVTWDASYTSDWLSGVSATGNFYNLGEADIPTGNSGIPTGWTTCNGSNPIAFADANVKALCVARWDTNGDGELSYAEAAAVVNIGTVFESKTNITSFNELQYFVYLSSIQDQAFSYCTALTQITIPEAVTTIGNQAFYGCAALTQITIPEAVTSIGSRAFWNCPVLQTVYFNAINCTNMQTAYNSTLYSVFSSNGSGGPSALTRVVIGSQVTRIPDYAFKGSEDIYQRLVIPASVTSIGDYAFCDCNSIVQMVIQGNSLQTIGGHAFENCSALASTLNLPNSVTSIGDYAFDGCSNLKGTLNLSNVNSLGSYAFHGCSSITGTLTLCNTLTKIKPYTFYGCSGITGHLVIPNSVTSIGEYVFYGIQCVELTIGEGVTSIGGDAFWNCPQLQTVHFNATNCTSMVTSYSSSSQYSVFNSTDSSSSAQCPIVTLTIGSNVTRIPNYAFRNSSNMTSAIVIPDATTYIGQYAFYGSHSPELTIGEGVTSIGGYAFWNCPQLQTVHFNATNCTSMVSNSQYSVFNVGNSNGSTPIVTLTIGSNVTRIPDYAFRNSSNMTSAIVIPDATTYIGQYAFYGSHSPELTIGEGVTSIGGSAFWNCPQLQTVHFNATNCTSTNSQHPVFNSGTSNDGASPIVTLTIGGNVTRIPDNAFRNSTNLTGNLIFPDGLTSIGSYAFCQCGHLTGDLVIPNSVTTLGSGAFRDCSGFNGSLIIGNGVQAVNQYVFAGCTGFLGTLIVGRQVNTVGNYAFQNCSGFASVISENPMPPTAVTNSFQGMTYTIPLYVPYGTMSSYQNATGWNLFTNRVEQCVFDAVGMSNENWSNEECWYAFELPGANDVVCINSNCQMDIDANVLHTYVYNLNDVLTIKSGKTLTTPVGLGILQPSQLVMEEGSQIVNNVPGVHGTVQRQIGGYTSDNDGWYTIAAPIYGGMPVSNLTLGNYDLFAYDEPNHYWRNVKNEDNDFSQLNPAQGYLYANQANRTVALTGQFNASNAQISMPVTCIGDPLEGFNLVGNPYTNNISIGDVKINGVAQTAFYRAEGGNLVAYVASDNEPIKPGDGFFVKATENGTLTFGDTRSRGERQQDDNYVRLVLNKDGKVADRAYLRMNQGTAYEKLSMGAAHNQLYFKDNGQSYAIANRETESSMVPLFLENANGTYTIEATQLNAQCEYLHLIDNLTGADIDLLETPTYTFDSKPSNYASRFKLVFSEDQENASTDSESNFAYISNGELVISNEGQATLQVIDVLGRVVSTEIVSGSYNKALNLRAGLYIINLNGMTQKIVVK